MTNTFCNQCGAALADGARFCANCGAASGASDDATPTHGGGGASLVSSPPYAGFWLRFGAYLIDAIIFSFVASFVISPLFSAFVPSLIATSDDGSVDTGVAAFFMLILIVTLVQVALWVAYQAIALSRWGQTLGAKAVGIRVVTLDGQPLTLPAAVARSLVGLVSSLPLWLGYFWALWDARQQTWHDKAAGSVVILAR